MVLSILIRVPFLSVPMIADEGGYAYVARFWTESHQLYRDIPFDRPQGIFLIYKLIFSTTGASVEGVRLAAAIVNALTLAVIFLITWGAVSPRGAWLAAIVYAIFSASPAIEGFTANAEIFTLLPLAIGACLAWKQHWGWAGFVSGIAVLIKPAGISSLILALAWSVVVGSSGRSRGRLLLAFLVGPLASILHGYLVGWEFYWSSLVDRRLLLFSLVSMDLGDQIGWLGLSSAQTMPAWLAPATVAALGFIRCAGKVKLFGVLWLASSVVGMAVGGNWYWHYFVQLIPPLAFMSGASLLRSPMQWRPLWGGILMVSLGIFVWSQVPIWLLTPSQISWQLYHRQEYLLTPDIAEYVAQETEDQASVYVAFEAPQIYFFSNRRAAFPQLYRNEVYFSQELFQQVVEGIQNRLPDMIVWVQLPPSDRMSPGEFQKLLRVGYEQKHRIAGITIYGRRTP